MLLIIYTVYWEVIISKYTVIKYYNDDGKKVASTKLDEAQVGTSFNTTSYHDGYAYINNIGL